MKGFSTSSTCQCFFGGLTMSEEVAWKSWRSFFESGFKECLEFGKAFFKFCDASVFGVHERQDTSFCHVTKDQFENKIGKCRERLPKIKLHFLPSHSPNLNVIERLWKFFKKEILYNTYDEKFSDFLASCKSFFRCRTKYAGHCAHASPKTSSSTQNKRNF